MSKKYYSIQYAEEQAHVLEPEGSDSNKSKDNIEQVINKSSRNSNSNKSHDEESLINTLVDGRELYDLHLLSLHEAKTKVGKIAHSIASSNTIRCAGFIHGKGIHSVPSDFFHIMRMSEEELDKDGTLKTEIRKYLKSLAIKLKCMVVNGEDMFDFTFKNSFEERIRMQYRLTPDNSGIVYFMNQTYFDLFSNSDIVWTLERKQDFQQVSII